jgi:phosphoribosylanthranilate isomerase
MKPGAESPFPIVQVAGVLDSSEAEMLVGCGVDWIGFPLGLAYHREDLTAAEAAKIVAAIGGRAECVLITYLAEPEEIARLADSIGARKVQLHGDVAPAAVEMLKRGRPDLFLVKSLIVGRQSAGELQEAVARFAPWVDAFIADTYDPSTGASGATGKTHDWAVSRRVVEFSPCPVILAGGLTPDNVAEAIRIVRPAGVDSHTGIEGEDGRKSPERVRRFVANAREAFARLV